MIAHAAHAEFLQAVSDVKIFQYQNRILSGVGGVSTSSSIWEATNSHGTKHRISAHWVFPSF